MARPCGTGRSQPISIEEAGDEILLRIVHYNLTTTSKEGGVETFVWELSQEQARRGHEVTIIGGAGPVMRDVQHVRVRRYPFIDRMTWRSFAPLRRHFELTKLLERLSMLPAALPALLAARPDIVHLHKPYDFLIAPLAHLWGAKVVYHGHGEDFYPFDQVFARPIDGMLSCSGYNAMTVAARYERQPEGYSTASTRTISRRSCPILNFERDCSRRTNVRS